MLSQIFSLSRKRKQILILSTDIVSVTISYYAAYALRLNSLTEPFATGMAGICVWLSLLVVTIGMFYRTGQYRTIIHYMSSQALNSILISLTVSCLSLYLFSALFAVHIPRTVPAIYLAFMAILYGGARLFIRNLYIYAQRTRISPHVIIYGAGRCGTELAAALQSTNAFYPVAFIDDDPHTWKNIIHGIPVYPFEELGRLIRIYDAKKILLAIPRMHRSERRALLGKLKPYKLAVLSVPSLVDKISSEKTDPLALEEIKVEDILGRDPVQPMQELLFRTTQGKAVMVTGAGGSIGSELCRQIVTHNPSRLVLYELSEVSLYLIEQELRQIAHDVEIIPCLGDVKNTVDMTEKLRTFGIQTVYHAAAYKHVPMVELNVIAGIQNNIFGTLHAAQAAISAGVERFVLISTDKAVRPTNIMGTTKRVAELILQAYAAVQKKTCFCMVRFGNVLGSSGSVFPLFRKQIAKGGPVTVTHAEVTRYFMTIPEAVSLVLQASGMAEGGEVFVLDMGEPVKIIDMARAMVELAGKSYRDAEHPEGEIEIRVVGLRPGEKLYEELLVSNNPQPTRHPRIMHQKEDCLPMETLQQRLQQLQEACDARDVPAIVEILKSRATDYHPNGVISDVVWKEKLAHS